MTSPSPTPTSNLDPMLRRMVYGAQVGDEHLEELALIVEIDLAHTTMLAHAGLLSSADATSLKHVAAQLFRQALEPLKGRPLERGIYMVYESYVQERVGPEVSGRIHLGRSRNDLNATLFRMRLRRPLLRVQWEALRLLSSLVQLAEAESRRLLPHHTHFQAAFPLSVGHYFVAVASALADNLAWLASGCEAIDTCPLGAGAGAGTSVPIEPEVTARLLGFVRPVMNSLDAVASRDLGLRVACALSVASVALERMCSDVLLWLSSERKYASLPDALVGASSMLPQKRNPFVVEHLRAWLRSSASAANAMMITSFGTSNTNSIEAGTEATSHLWPSLARFADACALLRRVVVALRWDDARLQAAAAAGCVTAFIASEDLAADGVPFRQAHAMVAHAVGGRTYAAAPAAKQALQLTPPGAALDRLVRGGGPGDIGSHTTNVSRLRAFRDSAVQRHIADRRRWGRSSRMLREAPHE